MMGFLRDIPMSEYNKKASMLSELRYTLLVQMKRTLELNHFCIHAINTHTHTPLYSDPFSA